MAVQTDEVPLEDRLANALKACQEENLSIRSDLSTLRTLYTEADATTERLKKQKSTLIQESEHKTLEVVALQSAHTQLELEGCALQAELACLTAEREHLAADLANLKVRQSLSTG